MLIASTARAVSNFNANPNMWNGFAGANCFQNGDSPVFCEIGKWLIIIDACSVGVYGDEDADDYGGLQIDCKFCNAETATAFLQGLPDDFNPFAYGAKPC